MTLRLNNGLSWPGDKANMKTPIAPIDRPSHAQPNIIHLSVTEPAAITEARSLVSARMHSQPDFQRDLDDRIDALIDALCVLSHAWSSRDLSDLPAALQSVRNHCSALGLENAARVAGDVLKALRRGDEAALCATLARLCRLTDIGVSVCCTL